MSTEETVVRAKFQKPIFQASDWMIVRYLNMDTGNAFTAVGNNLPTVKNVTVALSGDWVDHATYGKQFQVNFYEVELPSSKDGVCAYLASLKVGIGTKTARLVYQKYGEQVWSIIENSPEELLSVRGITQNVLSKLNEVLEKTKVARQIFQRFRGCTEMPASKIQKLIKAFGQDKVLSVIDQDTYQICKINGFTFRIVDALARSLGTRLSDPKRCMAVIDFIFDEAAQRGHVCVPKDEYLSMMLRELNYNANGEAPVQKEQCMEVINQAFRDGLIKATGNMLYSQDRYLEEDGIAKLLAKLIRGKLEPIHDVAPLIDQYEKENNIELAESQRKAIANVFLHPVSIITGGPGTGKSTIIKAVLTVHKQIFGDDSKHLLLAPTGRAARRISEVSDCDASTIHAALGFRKSDDEEDVILTNELNANLIIVDEVSMMDQHIAYALIQRVPPDARIVFVGDSDQLPSVGCGNVLHEMIRSKVIPTTELDVIFRQAQDNPIVANSHAIRCGQTDLMYSKTFRFLQSSDPTEIIMAACKLYVKCVNAYGIDNVVLLNPYREKSDLNVKSFNRMLQDILNPSVQGKLTIRSRGTEFRIGDRIMQTRNTDTAKNGDIGYVKSIIRRPDPSNTEQWHLLAIVEFNGDGHELTYSEEDLEDVTLAYAQTVHKSQGSQYRTVLMIVSMQHKVALRRNLIYTGITRSQENVALIGEPEALYEAIQNDKTDARYTLLADRLHHLLK